MTRTWTTYPPARRGLFLDACLIAALLLVSHVPDSHAEYGWYSHNSVLGGLGGPLKYVDVKDLSDKFDRYEFTIEAWVYPTSRSHVATIVSKGNPAALAATQVVFSFFINKNGTLGFQVKNTKVTDPSSKTIPLEQWTHVAVTISLKDIPDADPIYDATFYVDGTNGGQVTSNPAPYQGSPAGKKALRIGGSEVAPSEYFEGFIDEVRFWSVIRSGNAIRDNRFVGLGDYTGSNQGSALTASTAYTGLMSSWTFNTPGIPRLCRGTPRV